MNTYVLEKPRVKVDAMLLLRTLAKILKFETTKAERERIDGFCSRYHEINADISKTGADKILGMLAQLRKDVADGVEEDLPTGAELRQKIQLRRRALKERLAALFLKAREFGEPLRAKLATVIEKHVDAEEAKEQKRYEAVGIPYISSDYTRAMRQSLELIQRPLPGMGHVRPCDVFMWIDPETLPQPKDA